VGALFRSVRCTNINHVVFTYSYPSVINIKRAYMIRLKLEQLSEDLTDRNAFISNSLMSSLYARSALLQGLLYFCVHSPFRLQFVVIL